jgi:hypothetical protein
MHSSHILPRRNSVAAGQDKRQLCNVNTRYPCFVTRRIDGRRNHHEAVMNMHDVRFCSLQEAKEVSPSVLKPRSFSSPD